VIVVMNVSLPTFRVGLVIGIYLRTTFTKNGWQKPYEIHFCVTW